MKRALVIFIFLLTYRTLCAQLSEFDKADSVAELYPGHSLSDLGLLSYKLTHELNTDVSKFRAIYKWVCLNIKADHELQKVIERQSSKLSSDKFKKWNRDYSIKVIDQLIKESTTVCSGYSWLLKELSIRAGFECVIIYGYGMSNKSKITPGIPNHSWNAVKLDGCWYLCDATWSSGYVVGGTYEFIRKYKDTYFLADPKVFILNHLPIDSKWKLTDRL